jgi:hypothetical protein
MQIPKTLRILASDETLAGYDFVHPFQLRQPQRGLQISQTEIET